MKQIAEFNKELGDGASATGALVIEEQLLKAKVEVSYPVSKIVEPATKALDQLLDKIKAAIPGTWDDVLIDKFKAEYKDDLVKIISE